MGSVGIETDTVARFDEHLLSVINEDKSPFEGEYDLLPFVDERIIGQFRPHGHDIGIHETV